MIAYHMSPVVHAVGKILKGDGQPKVDPAVEQALERFRPKSCLDRLSSVYSREKTDFAMLGIESGYIYRVAISGDCDRHDATWVGRLQLARLKSKYAVSDSSLVRGWPDWTDDFAATTSANYWTGLASNEPLWELLSTEAEVKAQLSSTLVTAAATKGGWQCP